MRNVFTIDADIKLKTLINEPTVVQNDDIRFIINVFDGGQPLSLDSATTISLASVRLDRQTVVTPGTKIGTNTVRFDLGTEETKFPGRVEATAQFYDSEGRVSTISFSYRVVKDPTGDGYVPSKREQTLIETVLNDGPLIIQQAQDAANFANEQGQFAQTQANAANEAATSANEAAQSAANAANEANAAAQSANTAAQLVNDAVTSANAATQNANDAAANANEAADNATTQAQYARQQGDYAKTQGDYAKEQGDAANLAANNANDAANNANNAANNADNAADNANAAADNANTKATYAQQQGDYAKAQAALIDDILDQGLVVEVNGKTGNVTLTAEDVNAIPISEKGAVGGVARLNEDGKVVDANGNEVEGKVKTVNGIGPDENGNIEIETATSWNDLSDKPTTFPPSSHTHQISEINGLQDSLNEKASNVNLISLEQTLNEHSAKKIHQGEVHGLRLTDGKLEYFDGQEWQRVEVETTPVKQRIYGVRIDKNNSNPETRVTYIGDATGFTPMRGNNGNFQFGSWQSVFESFEIKPCVLKNKQVQYYLYPNDFTKKIDGSPANLTGEDGDVMIEFGKPLWWKWTDEGTTYTIEISDKAFDGAVKHAFEIEEGYNLVPYYALLLTQILFIIFFKSTNSQTALGRGYVDNNANFISTGNTNNKGMFYGSESGGQQMKFLGIEDYWGNKVWWIDGLVTDSSHNLLIGKGNFNDSGSGYQTFKSGVSSNLDGYINSVQGGNEKGFIIKTGIGSETTYYADYGYLYSSKVAYFGGSRFNVSFSGFTYLVLDSSASSSYASAGARLFCSVGDKIYIGAYLGTSQNGKLRSISGVSEPTGSKTIGTFRTEARANN